ncbi:alpha/beta fold hydrolase [Streptomyces sp. SID8354]|nr:alpha/beta fold hydrolase [Streptomyces sp. SID8354]
MWLRRFRPVPHPRVRLVCLPHAGGSASFYRLWADALPWDVELVAVQYPGRMDRLREPCIEEAGKMADLLCEELRLLSGRPLVLFGHSLGALLAYEVARRLDRPGTPAPAQLVLSGRAAPGTRPPTTVHLGDDEELWAELRRLGGTSDEVSAQPELRSLVLPALRSDYRLAETYRHVPGPPLSCPVTVCVGERDTEVSREQAAAWSRYTRGGCEVAVFPGGHFYLNPERDRLLELLSGALARHTLP